MTLPKQINPVKPQDTAVAPYNFVPLNDELVTIEDANSLPDQDRYGSHGENSWTGTIHCTLMTETPTFVRAPLEVSEYERLDPKKDSEQPYDKRIKNKADFFYTDPDKTPRIPGSSLRGMVRTLVEMASHGKFDGVTERALVYRSVGDVTSHGERYREQIMRLDEQGYDERNKRFQAYTPLVHAGYMIQEGGDWYIYPARNIGGTTFARINQRMLDRVGRSLSNVQGCRNASYIYIQPGPWQHQPIRGGLIQIRYSKVLRATGQPEKGLVRGVLARSGRMFSKRSEAVVFPIDKDADRIPVSDELVTAYMEQISQEQQQLLGPKGVLTAGEKGDAEKDGEDNQPSHRQPVFYIKDGEGQLRFFGHTMMMRVPYPHNPKELVPATLRRTEDIDLTEAIFGYTKEKGEGKARSYASRIFFSDAVVIPNQTNIFLSETPIVPKILASPKATAFQHYLVQENPDPAEIGRTRDGRPRYQKDLADYASAPESQTVLRGYKLYWHKGKVVTADDIAEPAETFNRMNPKNKERRARDSQYTQLKPVRAGVQFAFDIRFENLSNVELGAILWTLMLPGDESSIYRHKLGMAKPLGMGTIQLKPTLLLDDRPRRYQSLFANTDGRAGWNLGQRAPAEGKSAEHFISAFESFIIQNVEGTSGNSQRLHDLHRIKALLKLMAWPGPDVEETRYMEIERPDSSAKRGKRNEYRDRPVLPSPLPTGVAPVRPQKERRTTSVVSESKLVESKANTELAAAFMAHLQGAEDMTGSSTTDESQSTRQLAQPASIDEVKPNMWLKGTVKAIEATRLVVALGFADASLVLDQISPPAQTSSEIESRFKIGIELEVKVRRINKKGRIQLTMQD